jgi:hypothetical protein
MRKPKNPDCTKRVKLSVSVSRMLHARIGAYATLSGQTISDLVEGMLIESMKNKFHISNIETGPLLSESSDSVDLSVHKRSA